MSLTVNRSFEHTKNNNTETTTDTITSTLHGLTLQSQHDPLQLTDTHPSTRTPFDEQEKTRG
jgi:hypothetical protein